MKRILNISLIVILAVPGLVSFQNFDTNAKIKAMFVYNFTKYIEWPQNYKSGNFIIGILGDTPLYAEIKSMTDTKKAMNQSFELKKFANTSQISQCHMLLVPKDEAAKLPEVLAKVDGFSTLVITEEDGLGKKGAGINFVVRDNRQKFELNKPRVEKHDLKVASSLLSLAIVIE